MDRSSKKNEEGVAAWNRWLSRGAKRRKSKTTRVVRGKRKKEERGGSRNWPIRPRNFKGRRKKALEGFEASWKKDAAARGKSRTENNRR